MEYVLFEDSWKGGLNVVEEAQIGKQILPGLRIGKKIAGRECCQRQS
jgi:hypothetical protein